jgi:hypothetical protein
MALTDPLALLERPDKWYLGNAGMLLYAPPFPQHLDVPGFWDECHFGDLSVPRLLCVSFAVGAPHGAPAGRPWAAPTELVPVLQSWRWFPDRIDAEYELCVREGPGALQHIPAGLRLSETRRLGPDGTLYCDLRVEAAPDFPGAVLHTVAWTARQKGSGERADSHGGFAWDTAALGYTQAVASRAHARGVEALPLRISMSGTLPPTSVQATPAHGANLAPRLSFTPLWDSLKHGALSGNVVGQNVLGSVVYAGLHWRTEIKPRAAKPYCLGVRVGVRDPRSGSRPLPGSAEAAAGGVHTAPRQLDPALAWREFISLVPHFECSDAMLTRYYWYRWYGLRLNSVPAGGKYAAPGVTEGIAYFRGVITYSLMCHINECKWLADPVLAQGCLRNHIAHQTKAGHFAGHIYATQVNDKGFYHTDVGASVAALLLHHPSAQFCAEIFKPLLRLLAYYTKERDSEGLSLFDVWDQYETGQEFTSRYFHADKKADLYGWEHKLRLKGVDVTHYTYQLAQLLRELAQTLGEVKEVRRLADLAERIKGAVRQLLWDNERQFFFDYGVPQKKRSPYWTAVGFYPLLGNLASAEQARSAGLHLLAPAQGGTGKFAAPWPTPTVPDGDPHFEADPLWRGERANCPWNGRVWPMVNSHIVDVLGELSAAEPQRYRPELARYLRRFVEMMHFEGRAAVSGRSVEAKPCFAQDSKQAQHGCATTGEEMAGTETYPTDNARAGSDARPPKDFSRPNCFEHYHPFDGTGCEYRGIDDYMHSWVVDPLLKYTAGVRLTPSGPGLDAARLTVDPFPFGLSHLLLLNCHVHGHKLDVCFNRDRQGKDSPGYRVYLDGKLAFRAAEITPWEVEL